ncbi:protein FAR1-RELATED SEQUENCE 5-like [Coffea eugenioides]|uniref:protein FAR1-RELATED SEQUENCE 5-like n=1 Tax=Coffea eugenioides TaxID=49369 RepID=UPI000F6077E3|nr:protein FAR1-RELATED SEQUENCE 5-like [Coffea eugenioides]
MEFNSEEDAYKFYNKYAFKMSFCVRKDYLNKDKDGVTTSRRCSYFKEGVKRKYEGDVMPKRTRALTKTGCEVKMVIVLLRGTMKYRSHELMGKEVGGMGNVGYTRDDFKRYLRTRRKRSLKYGEAVTFDTTYKTNKEYWPLGVFVGFNQHRQIVIFNAAFMYDEMIDSFKWVFGTFLEAMCEKRPRTILTDQNHHIAAALSLVIPQTFHGLYTFHIKHNFIKHLDNHYKENSDLPYMFGACMYEIEEVEQFNRVWEAMFFRHFNRVIDDKRHNELIAEYEMRQKLPMIGLRQTSMLVHAAETYSLTVFVTFQNEYGESTAMVILRQQDAGMFVEFTVMRYDGEPERIVVFN